MYGPSSAISPMPKTAPTLVRPVAAVSMRTVSSRTGSSHSGCRPGSTDPVRENSGNTATSQSFLAASSRTSRCRPRLAYGRPFSAVRAASRARVTSARWPWTLGCSPGHSRGFAGRVLSAPRSSAPQPSPVGRDIPRASGRKRPELASVLLRALTHPIRMVTSCSQDGRVAEGTSEAATTQRRRRTVTTFP